MIPVTVFAGQKVAIFGLGGSGLASASALLAGGADVIGWDDNAESVVKATSAGIPTADLREVDWSRVAALVLAPGVPLTHPAPHWSAALAQRRRRRGDRRHRAVLPRAAPDRADGAVRRHHRHQRQVDHHRADLAPPALGRARRPDGRQYRDRDPVARAVGRSRAYVVECSSYQIDLAPTLDPSVGILLNLTEDHLDRHGTLRALRRREGAAGRGVRRTEPRSSRRR